MRKLTREGWFSYVVFPSASLAALLVFGFLIDSGPLFLTIVVPISLGGSVSFVPAFWWGNHFGKPVSRRATDLSVTGLIVSVLTDLTRFALAANYGLLGSILEGIALVCFVPGFLAGLYYVSIDNDKIWAGQRLIITGWISLIFVYFGSRGAHNISFDIFHVDLLTPDLWLWIGRVGLEAAPFLMALGILTIRPQTPLAIGQDEEPSKKSWGEALRGMSPWVAMIGVVLSGLSITVLGGLITIIIGVLLYPIGRIVTMLTRQETTA